ncbi:phage stabilization protein [Caudoviricetes sp.]|nr:phage stabilization protein [Caudoviricetes sp.]
MTAKVVTLQVGPGIQRDSTQFASVSYVDGKWVRFQYSRPRKIGGYNGSFLDASGISRGMIMSAQDGLNYVISGYNNGIEQWTTDNDDAVGFGPTPIEPVGPLASVIILDQGSLYTNGTYTNVPLHAASGSGALATVVVSSNLIFSVTVTAGGVNYVHNEHITINAADVGGTGSGFDSIVDGLTTYDPNDNTLWQFDIGYDALGNGQNNLIAHPGQNLNDISSTVNARPMYGPFTGTTLQPVGIFTASGTTTIGTPTVTFAQTYAAMGPGVSVSGTGIPANTTIVSALEVAGIWTVTLSNNATASGTVTLTFDNNVSVSGGIVMLFPYLFVYGNNGLIKNCAAGDFNNWTSADSNENNVASTKVIKGLPVRGGTTSPAGLFWTLDSVVRVTYAPTTVGSQTFYWKYDLITQQSSIMSSQCVIEYDGIFFWIGTDRFLIYNGVVQELENKQNFNYFFDNLNVAQRQKVWVSKVPRWGEIWWFFPNGDSEECNDAIIYNVREKVWYDAGTAMGARRSAGVFSEVFRKPIWAGNEVNTAGQYTLWQHETGTNEVYTNRVNAIDSFFETNVIGARAGLVGAVEQPGDNVWTRCERIEPDFVQSGPMEITVTGKGYADENDQDSTPYTFDPDTLKVDMREQRREMRLRFRSNTQNGDYFMGRVLLSLDTGDVRGTGNP